MAVAVAIFLRQQRRLSPSKSERDEKRTDSARVPLRFDHEDALERLKDHSANHYAGLYNVMKGVTLAAAGLTLIRLTDGYPAQRLPLFAIGLLAIAITYNGAIVGQTVVHLRTNLVDVLLPMALTVAEFVVIGMAASPPKNAAIPPYWFAALGAWQILASCVVASVACRLKKDMYSPSLWPAVRKYRKRQWFDAGAAGISGVITFIVWLTHRSDSTEAGTTSILLLLFTFATLAVAMVNHERTRRHLEIDLREQASGPG